MSALLSFLGGSAFRMIWGEVSHWITAAREHKREIEAMRLQGELDAAQHARNLEAIKVQAGLGIQTIRVQAEADIGKIDVDTFQEGVKLTGKTIGVAWVDAWNAIIRPATATWSIGMLTLDAFEVLKVSEATLSVCFAALGLYLADRALARRGK